MRVAPQKSPKCWGPKCTHIPPTLSLLLTLQETNSYEAQLEIHLEDAEQSQSFDQNHFILCQSISRCHVKEMKIVGYQKLTSLFDMSFVSTMLLEKLTIEECHGLKHIVMFEGNDDGHINGLKILPKLNKLKVKDCEQLEYVIGGYHHEKHLSYAKWPALELFPALDQLHLQALPNIISISQNNDNPTWSALKLFHLEGCPQFAITAISDLLVFPYGRKVDHSVNEDLGVHEKQVHTLEIPQVQESHIEGIICVEKSPVFEQEVSLGIKTFLLLNLPNLRYTFGGSKHIVNLQNLTSWFIEGCGKLKFIFSTTVSRRLPQLKILFIINCEALKQIVEEDDQNQNVSNPYNFQETCFPVLEFLYIKSCNKVKSLFGMNTPYEFPKLKQLVIVECSDLVEIFGSSGMGETEKQVENALPKLECLSLLELPSFSNFCQWSELQNAKYCFVLNTPKLSLTSTATFEEVIDHLFEVFYHQAFSLHPEFLLYRPGLGELKRLKAYEKELDVKEAKEDIVREGSAPQIQPATSPSTDLDVTKVPSTSTSTAYFSEATSLGQQQPARLAKSKGSIDEGLNEPISVKAPEKIKSANETAQTLNENLGFAQKTSTQNNAEIVQQIVQETQNPSPALLQKESEQSNIGSCVRQSCMLQKASVAFEETNGTRQKFDKPSNLPQSTSLQEMEMQGRVSSSSEIITNEQEFDGKQSMGAPISLKQVAHEHKKATTSKEISKKTAMTMSPTIPESKDTALRKSSPMELVSQESRNEAITDDQKIIKGSVQESHESKKANIVNFATNDPVSGSLTLEISVTSLHETSTHPMEMLEKGLSEPISMEALQESKNTNETTQTVGKLRDLVLKTSPQIPTTISKTETCHDKASKANSLNVEGIKNDIITLFKSMEEEDGDVQNPTTAVSKVPIEYLNLENNNVAKAFTDLEAYLKMPLKDIVNSQPSSHCLENALKLLSSWSCGNGAPLEGLKSTVDCLLHDWPNILSSFKQSSDTLDKFAMFEKKDKFLKEELPQRKEEAITLISKISVTEQSIAKAQLEEADLKEQIYMLQDQLKRKENEIKGHEVHLSSLKEQMNKLNEDTIAFKTEFETLKKGKSEMVEDQRKAQQELYTANYKWMAFCNQLEQNCKVARNLF